MSSVSPSLCVLVTSKLSCQSGVEDGHKETGEKAVPVKFVRLSPAFCGLNPGAYEEQPGTTASMPAIASVIMNCFNPPGLRPFAGITVGPLIAATINSIQNT